MPWILGITGAMRTTPNVRRDLKHTKIHECYQNRSGNNLKKYESASGQEYIDSILGVRKLPNDRKLKK